MYRRTNKDRLSFEDFCLRLDSKLSSNNRWVILEKLIPWDEMEDDYAAHFCKDLGAPAKPFRMGLGALIIKERLKLSDEELVEQLKENPFLQFFIGMESFQYSAPFDPSMMVHFRKRIPAEVINECNERIVRYGMKKLEENHACNNDLTDPFPKDICLESADISRDEFPKPNQGTLLIDATCIPADIRYPTDLSLLNEAREATERLIDVMHKQVRYKFGHKPRTYRREARRQFLKVARKKSPRFGKIRIAISQQLRHLNRNLDSIDSLIACGASGLGAGKHWYRKLLVISELVRQQSIMYYSESRSIPDRIVSLTQPHIRPIVRGKARSKVEFGAKISISLTGNGFVFMDRLSWDAYNEGIDLKTQANIYLRRYGYYPKIICADQIYRTRANLTFCKQHGIRLSGPKLGRPKKNPYLAAEERKITLQDQRRRNAVEGKIGQGKRRFGLGLICTKLAETSESLIAINFLVMNLEKLLRLLFVWLYFIRSVLQRVLAFFNAIRCLIQPPAIQMG